MSIRRVVPIPLLLFLAASCGSVGQTETQARTTGVEPTTSVEALLTTQSHTVLEATTTAQISSLPLDLGPLPAGESPRISLDELHETIRNGEFGRFFTDDASWRAASVTVGLITDRGGTELTAPRAAPTFPGYVISGGSSTCLFSGPPRSDKTYQDAVPCTTLLVVNGQSGEIVRGSEIETVTDP